MRFDFNTGNEKEAVVFDYRKIAEAVRKALDAFEQILEPVREAVQSISDAAIIAAENYSAIMRRCVPGVSESIRIVAQKLARLVAIWIVGAGNSVVQISSDYDPSASDRLAALICVLVKSHSAAYLGHVCAVRKGRLLRCRDRGSSDSASDNDTNSKSFISSFAAAA